MLVDTDILIWYLRGDRRAAGFLRDCRPVTMSVVTYIELVQGMRSKQEHRALRRTIRRWGWRVLPLDESISSRAVAYVEKHFLSHALRLADALIAATAVSHDLTLATGNLKHYRVIDELTLRQFKAS